jgi:phosphate acetyltransferase
MGRTLLVVPTGPAVGLTSTCLGLLSALERRGVRAGYVKPLAQPHPHGRRTSRRARPRADRHRPARPAAGEVVEER